MLSVTDTGIGMAPEVLERAFEPFFTTKAPGAGSGLGLSMVYGFAKQSGGHLRIDSELGHGTRCASICRGRAAWKPRSYEADGCDLPHGKELILLVDDNAEMRAVARRHLASLGYRVSEAGSGPAALEILQADSGYRPAVHRRRHAGRDDRLPTGGGGAAAATRAEGAVHQRLFRTGAEQRAGEG